MAPERTNRSMAPMAFIRGRKKAGLAVGLVVVMGIMWVRVLIGHKPQAAAASETPVPSKPVAAGKASAKVEYLSLPVVAGRNDTIERDFFAGRDWSGYPKNAGSAASTDPEVVRPNADRTNENVGKVAKKLNLQAVLPTGSPQAFIDDQLVRVGDIIPLQDGTDLYLFEVKQIEGDSVLVECGGKSVTLKMK
jgi:hypothetical protein